MLSRIEQYSGKDITEMEGLFSSGYSGEKTGELIPQGKIEKEDIKRLIENMISEVSPLKNYIGGIKGFTEMYPKIYMEVVSEVLFQNLFEIRRETRIQRRDIDLLKVQLSKVSGQIRSRISLGGRDFLLSAAGILIGSSLLIGGLVLHLNFILFCGFSSIVIGILHTVKMK